MLLQVVEKRTSFHVLHEQVYCVRVVEKPIELDDVGVVEERLYLDFPGELVYEIVLLDDVLWDLLDREQRASALLPAHVHPPELPVAPALPHLEVLYGKRQDSRSTEVLGLLFRLDDSRKVQLPAGASVGRRGYFLADVVPERVRIRCRSFGLYVLELLGGKFLRDEFGAELTGQHRGLLGVPAGLLPGRVVALFIWILLEIPCFGRLYL